MERGLLVARAAPVFVLLLLLGSPRASEEDGPDLGWESWWVRERARLLDLRVTLFTTPETRGSTSAGVRLLSSRARRALVLPVLFEAARDRVPAVRRAAAVALGRCGDAEAHAPLLRLVEADPDRDVRHGAILGLGLAGHPAGVEPLRRFLADPRQDAESRAYAAAALGLSGGSADELAAALGEKGGAASPRELRLAAACALGLGDDPAAIPSLLRRLRRGAEADPAVRAAALLALGRLGDASARPTIETLLEDGDGVVRAAAARALADVAPAADLRARGRLEAIAGDDPIPFVRAQALLAIGSLGGTGAGSWIRRTLAGGEAAETDLVVPYAGFALVLAEGPEAGATLLEAFGREREARTRAGLALALGLAGEASASAALLGEVERIGNADLFQASAVALGLLRDGRAGAPLESAIARDRRPEIVRAAAVGRGLLGDASILDAIAGRLRRESSASLVGALAAALGDLRDARSVAPLLEASRRPGLPDAARAEIVAALGKIADRGRVSGPSRLARATLPLVTTPVLEAIAAME